MLLLIVVVDVALVQWRSCISQVPPTTSPFPSTCSSSFASTSSASASIHVSGVASVSSVSPSHTTLNSSCALTCSSSNLSDKSEEDADDEAGDLSGVRSGASSALARQWGAPLVVTLVREPDHGLGISIVGGKVDMFNLSSGHTISGIFIKNVLPDSPAGRSGLLKRGDRILEVSGADLREATHDQAVEAIKNATSPLEFLVQSLLPTVSFAIARLAPA